MMDDIINDVLPAMKLAYPFARRVERVRHELRRREVRVRRVEHPAPGLVRVVFDGPDLAGFTSLSFDDHLKFMFPAPDGQTVMRDYTPVGFDAAAGELTLEFALHPHGPASDWARQAVPGQTAMIGGPKGSMIIPLDYDWHLLAGDASALPAIRRRLRELRPGTRVRVRAWVEDAADRLPFDTQPGVALDLAWHDSAAACLEALRAEAWPEGEGFVWCAGEAVWAADARRLLIDERGHPREAARISAYWKRGAEGFHENL